MEHLISLSVGTKGVDDHAQTHQDLSELARNLGVTHNYVNVSSSLFGESDEDDIEEAGCTHEHVYYDDHTLDKVRDALQSVEVVSVPFDSNDAWTIINALLNAGILFRERTRTEG